MKKLILPIFFILLLIITPIGVFAKDPECWTKHMVRQMADCSKAFLECNNPCGAISDDSTRYGCFESCNKASKLCNEKASADYKACVRTGTQTSNPQEEGQAQSSPEPTDQQKTSPPVQVLKDNKEDKSPYDTGKIPVFINEWFNWVAEWIKVNTYVLSLESESWEKEKEEEKRELEELKKKQAEAKARLEANWEWQASETFWKSVAEAKFVAGPGDQSEVHRQPAAEYKKGGNNEFEPLLPTQILGHGDVIQVTRRAIIRTPNYVIEVYPKGAYEEKAVIELRDGKLLLKHGAVTIWKGRMYGEFIGTQYVWEGMETPVLDAVDVQTQYTVAHDEKANKSYVIVSEGEVKVTTKDGKTATITPNGDKPGIAVVSQKLSVIKLAALGLIPAVVIGGIIFFSKRKKKKK